MVPELRVCAINAAPVLEGDYVLYWMTAARRTRSSYALEHAVARARELRVPLLVFEALRVDYPWASQRLHQLVLQGMRDNRRACARAGVAYYPWVEPERGASRGLLEALASRASVVVSDDSAVFFLPHMLRAADRKLSVRLEAVDGAGLLPVRAIDRVFSRAVDFRRFLQRELPAHLRQAPEPDPLSIARDLPRLRELPADVTRAYPPAREDLDVRSVPVDSRVGTVALEGGPVAGASRLSQFLRDDLARYDQRQHPDLDTSSGLSPYLHFGHLGAHEVWSALVSHEGWSQEALSSRAAGQKEGFWGMSANAEAFVDELVTWRELGHNACVHQRDHDRFESLPAWAKATLEKHANDARRWVYSCAELERAETHDPVWNAAQRQLLSEGRVHGYLRMLWGKKILEWSASPREALATMLELNDKWAVDGRDPNSVSGIFWCLGRYDRPWGPERPIFGTVRYMTSDSAQKKLRLKKYLARWNGPGDAMELTLPG